MSATPNPYAAPTSNVSDPPAKIGLEKRGSKLWLPLYLFPLWLLFAFYGSWLVAWFDLGHQPIPMRDDPKYIGGLSDIMLWISMFIVMITPLALPLGLIASFFLPGKFRTRGGRALRGVLLAVIYLMASAAIIYLLRSDPGRVVEWWFD